MNNKSKWALRVFLMIIAVIALTAFSIGYKMAYNKVKYEPIKAHLAATRGSEYETIDDSIQWETQFMEGFEFRENIPLDEKYQRYLYMICKDYDIDYSLVLGQIDLESSFNPNTVSETKDWGLFQVNECNHSTVGPICGVINWLDPYQNTRAGMFILNGLFNKYGGDPNRVLMAYNMGEQGMREMINAGHSSSAYSREVLRRAEKYRKRPDK